MEISSYARKFIINRLVHNTLHKLILFREVRLYLNLTIRYKSL